MSLEPSALFGAVIPGSDELEMLSKYFNKIVIINDLLPPLHAYFTVIVMGANIRRNEGR
jgi:hypothetical protein